ncbi:hypothetical protein SteCoe_35907 [Stentor coeruleus]|uniref:Non-specific serine/threonine protein kinase n=1 Tax=Stentor coeruleus TaxID=5963 RepID=A0A1R2AR85_9CILI|nr:hypothetical protein SteCoe_35907 [Stentor coeruleus]
MGKICSCLCPSKDPEKPEELESSPLSASFIPAPILEHHPKISKKDFEILKLIGKGQFGKVFMVSLKKTGALYAMKVLQKKDIEKNQQKLHTANERSILIKNSSPFIVQLKYSFQDFHQIYLVLEFVQGGELFYQLRKAGRFSEDRAQFYAAEIVLALEYLHSNGIIYRDLKPENILLCSDGHIKLTDFGLSKLGVDEKNPLAYTFCGTSDYLAPEIIKNKGYDKAVDFWSLGAVLYEMIAGLSPFYSQNRDEIYKKVLKRNFEMKPYFSQEASDIISKLLTLDPKIRSEHGSTLRSHPFFREIDWDKLEKKEYPPPFRPRLSNNMDLRYFDEEFTSEKVNESVKSSNETGSYLFQDFTYVDDG